MKSRVFTIAGILVLLVAPAFSQQLVYRPINPAFGGDTFNYQWLLSSAQAQNKMEERGRGGFGANLLDDFENNLNRQILNQLSRKVIDEIFGEGSLQDGEFEFGTLKVNIASEADGINIDIVNSKDGSTTNIIVPYY
ncbi:MAG TPA: curli assembly protein CsgF [Chryseosolibacter sp.]|nr:curli assembly protein CsgF [Chryseosolibacter sp.]